MRKVRKFVFNKRATVCGLIIIIAAFGLLAWQNRSRTPHLPEPPLKELAARHNIELGNFAITSRLNEKPYSDILSSQFNVALADNTPNWYFTDGGLRPSKDAFDFKRFDEVVSYAESHQMAVQAHHYVWGEQKWLPDWLKKGSFTKPELLQLMHNHIQTVGSHYAGKIKEWTVVNEAFSRDQHVFDLRDWWADQLGGKDYIDNAFIWARQADPQAKLILNDFDNEGINDISNEMYAYVKAAKQRGVPIDGIGLQMHIDGTHPPQKNEVISNMRRFSELGVDVYVTEFDVNMHDLKASNETKDEVEGNIYYEMARACIESKVCRSFSLLGITDKETWYNYIGLRDARPLMFNEHYQPKPAYYAFRHALEQP